MTRSFLIFALSILTTTIGLAATATDSYSIRKQVSDSLKKEVLLIGTFHYHNPGADVAKTKSFDVMSEEAQRELEKISSDITTYNPSKIFVEWPYNKQKN